MTKELFIDCIEALKEQNDIDRNVAINLRKAFPDTFEGDLLPNNSVITNMLIHILRTETKDCCDWINYYCWELDFGKENDRLKVYDKDEKEIPLKSPEDLYKLLIEK